MTEVAMISTAVAAAQTANLANGALGNPPENWNDYIAEPLIYFSVTGSVDDGTIDVQPRGELPEGCDTPTF
jgi:hypothetical protein